MTGGSDIPDGDLCFSDLSGFAHVDIYKRSETWEYNGDKSNAPAAFAGEDFVNIEITAQMLLAWRLFESELSIAIGCITIGNLTQ